MNKVESRNSSAQLLFVVDEEILRTHGLDEFSGSTITGGAARTVALDYLYGVRTIVRDVDVVTIDNLESEEDTIPIKGHDPESVRHYSSVEEYLDTRDFTINELCVRDNNLYMSQDCFDDLADRIVRPTPYTKDTDIRDGRTTARAILLRSRLSIETDQEWYLAMDDADLTRYDFDIAVCLDKALELGIRYADEYLAELDALGVFPNSDYLSHEDILLDRIEQIEKAKNYLEESLYDFNFRRSAKIARIALSVLENQDALVHQAGISTGPRSHREKYRPKRSPKPKSKK